MMRLSIFSQYLVSRLFGTSCMVPAFLYFTVGECFIFTSSETSFAIKNSTHLTFVFLCTCVFRSVVTVYFAVKYFSY